tara:strand:- start:1034 stop:1198 length:165 start_codon:yes stop_codon:yes gene_type:complete
MRVNIIMVIFESAIFWICVAAASEILALSKFKDNSIVELTLHVLRILKDKQKKD